MAISLETSRAWLMRAQLVFQPIASQVQSNTISTDLERRHSLSAARAMREIENQLFLQPFDRLTDSVNRVSHLSRVWRLIETDWRDSTLTLERAARAGGMNTNDLNILLRRITGFTFYQLLIRYRLHKAMVLLMTTALNVTDVALDNGFGSLTTFERNFRNVVGVPPRVFRFGG